MNTIEKERKERVLMFSKYSGKTASYVAKHDVNYLLWMQATELPTHFGFVDDIEYALKDMQTEYTLVHIKRPNLKIKIRGGGRFHGGTHITSLEKNGSEVSIDIETDKRSFSGKSGSYRYEQPTENGVYVLLRIHGSIRNQQRCRQYVVLKDEKWFEILENTKNSAMVYLNN